MQVDIQSATSEPAPEEGDIRRWITAALAGGSDRLQAELSVRLVDIEEMATLNKTYRDKSGPTNVLSFPADLPEHLEHPLLGDIVICGPVVAREAREQRKSLDAHWAHMTVHGTLHLLGYDHIDQSDANTMEALETTILGNLNYPCPYATTLTGSKEQP